MHRQRGHGGRFPPGAEIDGGATDVTDAEPTTTTTAAPATSVATTAAHTATITTTTEPPRVWDGLDRINIMLLGSDAGVGRTGTRTDTVIAVSIAPETGDAAMFYDNGTTGHAGYQIYDLEQIQADAHTLMEDPTVSLDSLDGDGWDDICSQSFD